MAAVAEIAGEQTAANTITTATITTTNNNDNNEKSNNKLESPKSDSEFNVQKLVDMFTKLNPLAKELFFSYYHQNGDDQNNNFANNNKHSANDNSPGGVWQVPSVVACCRLLCGLHFLLLWISRGEFFVLFRYVFLIVRGEGVPMVVEG
ncbi:hypothetical protein Pint_20251 [Pistacia integerrima]|uniref:Uncharacterized protein n=1 Tax=Pistacia integerrima TaxID=434235 RepID=A0ACC0XA69_9ROSI|nr:hypothetical protein Pint_20251 [Pistacia integerrima]